MNFTEVVEVVHIPRHNDYSKRIRDQYWSSADEIYENAYRNLLEFEMEGHWINAAEEDQMIRCQESGNLIHPVHFEGYSTHRRY